MSHTSHTSACECHSCRAFDEIHASFDVRLEDVSTSYAAWKRFRAEEKSWWRAVYRHWIWTMIHGKR